MGKISLFLCSYPCSISCWSCWISIKGKISEIHKRGYDQHQILSKLVV